jgi:hypothetical protein
MASTIRYTKHLVGLPCRISGVGSCPSSV